MQLRRPDYWNGWWTATIISAALTIVFAILTVIGHAR
jgi:hypothetical protein